MDEASHRKKREKKISSSSRKRGKRTTWAESTHSTQSGLAGDSTESKLELAER